MSNSFEYGDDGAAPAPTNEALRRITDLVRQAVVGARELEAEEERIKARREAQRQLVEELIPSAATELGLMQFTTLEGIRVTIREDMTHSLSEDRRDAGMNWLEQQGHGSIIKRELTVAFAKGQEDEAKVLAQEIVGSHPDLPLTQRRNVAPATLKALLKDLMKGGVDVPVDIFKVRAYRKAVLG